MTVRNAWPNKNKHKTCALFMFRHENTLSTMQQSPSPQPQTRMQVDSGSAGSAPLLAPSSMLREATLRLQGAVVAGQQQPQLPASLPNDGTRAILYWGEQLDRLPKLTAEERMALARTVRGSLFCLLNYALSQDSLPSPALLERKRTVEDEFKFFSERLQQAMLVKKNGCVRSIKVGAGAETRRTTSSVGTRNQAKGDSNGDIQAADSAG